MVCTPRRKSLRNPRRDGHNVPSTLHRQEMASRALRERNALERWNMVIGISCVLFLSGLAGFVYGYAIEQQSGIPPLETKYGFYSAMAWLFIPVAVMSYEDYRHTFLIATIWMALIVSFCVRCPNGRDTPGCSSYKPIE